MISKRMSEELVCTERMHSLEGNGEWKLRGYRACSGWHGRCPIKPMCVCVCTLWSINRSTFFRHFCLSVCYSSMLCQNGWIGGYPMPMLQGVVRIGFWIPSKILLWQHRTHTNQASATDTNCWWLNTSLHSSILKRDDNYDNFGDCHYHHTTPCLHAGAVLTCYFLAEPVSPCAQFSWLICFGYVHPLGQTKTYILLNAVRLLWCSVWFRRSPIIIQLTLCYSCVELSTENFLMICIVT